MAFERKKSSKKNVTNSYWQIFQWYLVIFPLFYFIFVMPSVFQQGSNGPVPYASVATLFMHVVNMGVGSVFFLTHPLERSRNGAANHLLIMAMIQQLITQSFFGFGLALIAWYKLPTMVSPEAMTSEMENQKSIASKWLAILMVILIILTVLVVLSIYMFN